MISDCHALLKNQLLILSSEVIHERANDPQEFIRKQVLETISQMEYNEIKAANEIKEIRIMNIVFESLRDESAAIRKMAL
jgi:vesicle coat complex subunit